MVVEIPYKPQGEPIIEFVDYNGAKFKTVTWKVPEGVQYKGKIIYVHGFAEHSSIYTEFFDKLSHEGYEIFFFDQRGAGETSPGKEVGKTNEAYVFDDLDFFIKKNLDQRTDSSEKFILAGHLMGGGIILNYGIRGKYRSDFKKIIACGPLIDLHAKTKPNIILRVLMPTAAKVLPNVKIDGALNFDYITSNEKWKNYIEQHDKKLLGTIRQFHDMFARGLQLLDKEYSSKFSPDIKLLVIHGTDDYINDIEKSKEFVANLDKGVDSKMVPVEKGRHSLFIEENLIFNSVFEEVLTFLNK